MLSVLRQDLKTTIWCVPSDRTVRPVAGPVILSPTSSTPDLCSPDLPEDLGNRSSSARPLTSLLANITIPPNLPGPCRFVCIYSTLDVYPVKTPVDTQLRTSMCASGCLHGMNEEEARTFRADNAGTTSQFEAEAETEIIVAQGFAEMSPEHQDWYDKAVRERNRLSLIHI